jgi:predicted MFS family arabinose efflux permease
MSASAPAAASQQTAGGTRERLISGQLSLVFLSEFSTLASFDLLLSVTPHYAAAAGGGSMGAGLVTGVLLLGTVAAELAAPLLMRRSGLRAVLVAGAVLLGIPALALLSPGSLIVNGAAAAARGFGFGLIGVVLGTLAATLVPPERRGEGLGLYGVVSCAPEVLALPAGIWLADHYGYPVVVGMAVATALVPLAAFPWLPSGTGRTTAAGDSDGEHPVRLIDGLRYAGQLRPFLIFAASTAAAGVIVAFLPLARGVSGNIAAAGLLTQALAATISRWWAGRNGDRHGHARLLAPALAIDSLGMAAMVWMASPVAVIAAMCLFGTGFGILQNATMALMVDRMPASAGTASALWNLAYDAGYGAGPAMFGLVAGHTGYPAVFAMSGVLMAAAVPMARRERSGAGPGGPAKATQVTGD